MPTMAVYSNILFLSNFYFLENSPISWHIINIMTQGFIGVTKELR